MKNKAEEEASMKESRPVLLACTYTRSVDTGSGVAY
jgi:hypothetical protein